MPKIIYEDSFMTIWSLLDDTQLRNQIDKLGFAEILSYYYQDMESEILNNLKNYADNKKISYDFTVPVKSKFELTE